MKYFEICFLELMASNFSPSSGSYVLNKFPSISQWSDTWPLWPSCFNASQRCNNSLPSNEFSDWFKLKAFADNKVNVRWKHKLFLGWVKNIMGKGENAVGQHFLLSPQCFQKASFPLLLKVGIVWYRVNSSELQIFFKIGGPGWPMEQNMVGHFLKWRAQSYRTKNIR